MKIGVINTGGTISCIGYPLSPMTAQEFSKACATILEPLVANEFNDLDLCYITDLNFPESVIATLDSTNLQPSDWCLMAECILDHYQAFDGWVLLHGTDSMDFTASALSMLLSRVNSMGIVTAAISKPVVITGSQVPLFYRKEGQRSLALNFNTDAYQNLCGAIRSAQTGIAEVCVYFQNRLYRGNRVLKTNASEFNAFSSPNYPLLAEYGVDYRLYAENILPGPVSYSVSLDNPLVLDQVKEQLSYFKRHIDAYPVMQFNAFPAGYSSKKSTAFIAQLIHACVDQGIKGLVLEAYGEGNFPSGNPDAPIKGAVYRALTEANAKGVVIVDCTQVISGVVNNSAYASGAWLPLAGALNSVDMTPVNAFVKLMTLLCAAGYNRWNLDVVKELVQLNLQGEMMNTSRLDSRVNCELLPGQFLSALDGSALLINDKTRGPVLMANSKDVLWSAFSTPPKDMPGCLVMQNDGDLVYYSRFNAPLWATATGSKRGASSQLMLSGSLALNTLVLQVYNYSTNGVGKILFP